MPCSAQKNIVRKICPHSMRMWHTRNEKDKRDYLSRDRDRVSLHAVHSVSVENDGSPSHHRIPDLESGSMFETQSLTRLHSRIKNHHDDFRKIASLTALRSGVGNGPGVRKLETPLPHPLEPFGQ